MCTGNYNDLTAKVNYPGWRKQGFLKVNNIVLEHQYRVMLFA